MTCHTWPRSCVSPRLRPTPHQKTRWRPSPESWESANLVLLILDGCLLAIVDAPNRWLQRSGHLPTSAENRTAKSGDGATGQTASENAEHHKLDRKIPALFLG